MIFNYGSYAHPNNEVNFAGLTRTIQFSPTARANILTEAWAMKGRIVKQGATSQADIFTALAALRTAYSVNGQSAWFNDNNGTRTPFFLDNTKAIGGVVVTSPISHGDIGGAESVTYLNYTFGLKMESFATLAAGSYLAYAETLVFEDNNGLPLLIERIPISGPPILQAVSTSSMFYATQSGTLTTRSMNPQPEAPLFPGAFSGEPNSRSIRYSSPKMVRGVAVEQSVSWSYRFKSPSPLVGTVHARG
jgi:hypothetical protein